MIVIVDERSLVQDAYCAQLTREGYAAQGLTSKQFASWIETSAPKDLEAVAGFLIAQNCFEYLRDESSVGPNFAKSLMAPVLVLVDKPALDVILKAFETGADDVLRKPMHVREILARVAVISKRGQKEEPAPANANRLQVGLDGSDPTIDGKEFKLPRRERRILEYLASIGERRATKSQIYNAIYGLFNEGVEETVVESHISKLRKKLKKALGYDPIDSQRFLGYRLILEDDHFGDADDLRKKASNDVERSSSAEVEPQAKSLAG